MNKRFLCLDCLKESNETDFIQSINPKNKYIGECKTCNGRTAAIDTLMYPIIVLLREKGYNPQFSCQGHTNYPNAGGPYLVLNEDVMKFNTIKDATFIKNGNGTAIYYKRNVDKKLAKDSVDFINKLKAWIKTLPKLKLNDKAILWNIFPEKSSSVKVHILVGRHRSLNYFKEKNIKEVKEIESLRELYNKLENSSCYININIIKEDFYLLDPDYFDNTLYIILPLKNELENIPFYFWENLNELSSWDDYAVAKAISKLYGDGKFHMINKDNEII